MLRIQRVWRSSLVGKAILIVGGLLALLVLIGVPVGLISLASGATTSPEPSSENAFATIPVTIYPSPTSMATPTSPPTLTPIATPSSVPTAEPSPSATVALTPEAAIAATLTVTDSNDYVNVRSGPGTTYSTLGRLDKGQSAPVTGKSQNGLWWQITFNNQPGWVYAPIARVTGDTNAVPVVQVQPSATPTATAPPR
ncbi:MAG: SH3 domain-containing protein [Chloroflexi bacterium]|nr:SH3 domain-containing protein [Chloroflexota bacterium]